MWYIACRFPNLVSIHFYTIRILHFNFYLLVILETYCHKRRKLSVFGGAMYNISRATRKRVIMWTAFDHCASIERMQQVELRMR